MEGGFTIFANMWSALASKDGQSFQFNVSQTGSLVREDVHDNLQPEPRVGKLGPGHERRGRRVSDQGSWWIWHVPIRVLQTWHAVRGWLLKLDL